MQQKKPKTHRKTFNGEVLERITELMQKRIDTPPLPATRTYNQREIIQAKKVEIQKALAAGHRLEDIIDDLKGVGLGLTIGSLRNYLKSPRKQATKRALTEKHSSAVETAREIADVKKKTPPTRTKKGSFEASEDTRDI